MQDVQSVRLPGAAGKALGETGPPEPRHGAGLLSQGRVLVLL